MQIEKPRGSLFSQKLDRSVFALYFLGAVVPMLALAVVVRRTVLPTLENDGFETAMVLGATGAIAFLCLLSFFAMRFVVHDALSRMEDHNRRLRTILGASRAIADAPHAHVVAQATAEYTVELTGAQAAVVLLAPEPDKPLVVSERAGEQADALYEACCDAVGEVADDVMASGQPVVIETGSGGASGGCAVVPIGVQDGPSGVIVVLGGRRLSRISAESRDVVSTLAGLAGVALRGAELRDAQQNFFSHATELLVTALDAHLDGRSGHAKQVAQLANRIGRELDLEEDELQRLHFAALLHDIGMLKMPREEALDPKHHRLHPQLGHRMLSRIRLWEQLAPIVLHHHERFDGNGFPGGLGGEAIPFEARILAVADAYDTKTREERGRPGLSSEDALAEIAGLAGSEYDPTVVAALERALAE